MQWVKSFFFDNDFKGIYRGIALTARCFSSVACYLVAATDSIYRLFKRNRAYSLGRAVAHVWLSRCFARTIIKKEEKQKTLTKTSNPIVMSTFINLWGSIRRHKSCWFRSVLLTAACDVTDFIHSQRQLEAPPQHTHTRARVWRCRSLGISLYGWHARTQHLSLYINAYGVCFGH